MRTRHESDVAILLESLDNEILEIRRLTLPPRCDVARVAMVFWMMSLMLLRILLIRLCAQKKKTIMSNHVAAKARDRQKNQYTCRSALLVLRDRATDVLFN